MQEPLDAERWRRVRDILHRALELPPHNREAYLVEVCGDQELRQEVDSLLAASERSAFIDEPDLALATIQGALSGRLQAGQNISHYRIVEQIGKGGMGEVYKATDTLLGRTVALKVIRDPDIGRKRRFAREAKAASALNHTNIITIYEFNSERGVDFIAMEYVEGAALNTLLGQPLGKLLDYARQAADAIRCAHSAGIVHRDLKPNNIMVTRDGIVKVLDFGLAKREDSVIDSETAGSTDLTRSGTLVGTPAYISPEQILGEEVGPTADIFCFGIILYEIASGRRPFAGNTALAILDQVVHKDPPALTSLSPATSPHLSALIEKCLRKAPAERPQSMAEVTAALNFIANQAGNPTTHRRRWIAAAAAAVLAAGSALYFGEAVMRRPTMPSLTYWIEAQKPGEDKPYRAQVADTFEALWKFRLHLKPPRSGFLYLVNQGPGENGAEDWWVLHSAGVTADQEVVTGWYVFDRNPGTERLWLVWVNQPIDELRTTGKVENPSRASRIRDALSAIRSQKETNPGNPALATLLELRHR
jgi:tRNA A-37 threonylcarbamoyl transferase component Bud32